MNRMLSFFLVVLCLVSCIKEKQTGADLAAGDRIPDLAVTMNDGTTLTGARLRTGTSCIMFFTTACPDCRQTLPHIQRIYDDYSGKGVKFALISREEGPETIAAYWSKKGFTMPYSAQTDRRIYNLFARTRVPRIYICRNGVIRSILTDQPSNPVYEDISAALESVL